MNSARPWASLYAILIFLLCNESDRDRQLGGACNNRNSRVVVISCNNYLSAAVICVHQTGRQDGQAILCEQGAERNGAERSKVGKAIYSSTGLNILHNFMIITMASTIITMIIILMCARLPEWGTLSFIVNIDSGPMSQDPGIIFIFSESCSELSEHWALMLLLAAGLIVIILLPFCTNELTVW